MKILLTAHSYGSANALVCPAKELIEREHDVTVYATGNDNEIKGFQNIPFQRINPDSKDYASLVDGYDVVVTGLSGFKTHDSYFLRTAVSQKIPTVGVVDRNNGYLDRLGGEIDHLPTILAVMDEDCKKRLELDLPQETGIELVKRARVVGWTAFDKYAQIREQFTYEDREKLLKEVGIDENNLVYVHFTLNCHPDSGYMANSVSSRKENEERFEYEMNVTKSVFEAASDLGVKLVVKPHPGEKFERNYTKELTDRHGFTFIPASACETQKLMLSAYSITAGRSTCLTEATLLDKNTGGIIPDMGDEWIPPFPPMALGAIPYTQKWEGVKDVVRCVTSKDETVQRRLAEDRKRFSIDGKASQRLADIVESLR